MTSNQSPSNELSRLPTDRSLETSTPPAISITYPSVRECFVACANADQVEEAVTICLTVLAQHKHCTIEEGWLEFAANMLRDVPQHKLILAFEHLHRQRFDVKVMPDAGEIIELGNELARLKHERETEGSVVDEMRRLRGDRDKHPEKYTRAEDFKMLLKTVAECAAKKPEPVAIVPFEQTERYKQAKIEVEAIREARTVVVEIDCGIDKETGEMLAVYKFCGVGDTPEAACEHLHQMLRFAGLWTIKPKS